MWAGSAGPERRRRRPPPPPPPRGKDERDLSLWLIAFRLASSSRTKKGALTANYVPHLSLRVTIIVTDSMWRKDQSYLEVPWNSSGSINKIWMLISAMYKLRKLLRILYYESEGIF